MFFFSSRRRHTRWTGDWSFRRVLFRSLSWDNPFINAPLVYENVTAIRDKYPPFSAADFVYGPYFYPKYEFRSEERRVGKECRHRGSAAAEKKKARLLYGSSATSCRYGS